MLDLHPGQWDQLGGLLFVARRLVEGLWAGRHASTRFGSGTEFHDYRAYAPGDDPADVDWKLFGRTDRYFVRRHRLFTDLQVYLLVDCSASMHFAGLDNRGRPLATPGALTKLRYAAMLAAAVAFLAIRQGDRAGLGLYADRLVAHVPVGGTWAHLQRVCRELEKATPVIRPGDVGAALRQAHAVLAGRGASSPRAAGASGGGISAPAGGRSGRKLLILIGDLLDEPGPLFDGLSRFRFGRGGLGGQPGASGGAGGGEVIVCQVLTPQELDLSGLGRLRLQLVDAETRRQVPTDLGRVQSRYAELMDAHLVAVGRGCAARGIDYNLLTTGEPVVQALRQYLRRRSALAR